MALPNLTNIAKKPMNPKADALAKMMDTSAIAQAGQPMAQKPPTLGTATGVAPSIKPMGFGGPQQPQMRRPEMPTTPIGTKTVQAGGTVQAPTLPTRPVAPKSPTVMTPVQTTPVQTTPSTPEPAAPSTQAEIDAMIRKFVESQLANAGNVDTSAQEALIRDQMEGKLGASLVDQRARMGRAGFGAGGVTAALESDARTNASREALDQILGFRTSENQRSVDNARNAISTEQGMRSAASDDALRRMVLETMQAESMLDATPAEQQAARTQETQTANGADTNGDGVTSEQESGAYVNAAMEGMQAVADRRASGDNSPLPVRSGPGDGFIVVQAPRKDRDGNPVAGVLYNPQTGELANYTG